MHSPDGGKKATNPLKGEVRIMQTFLPYPDFKRSAEALDRQRLGKQRSEALVLLRICRDGKSRWKNHPIWKMWSKNPEALALYGVVICEEWTRRGYRDTCREKILAANREMGGAELPELWRRYESREEGFLPSWFGSEEFHASHRSNLLRKDPGHYSAFSWEEPDDLCYLWPVPEKEEGD
jgi:hypothetical protein